MGNWACSKNLNQRGNFCIFQRSLTQALKYAKFHFFAKSWLFTRNGYMSRVFAINRQTIFKGGLQIHAHF